MTESCDEYEWVNERMKEKRVAVSLSGGKDSAALALHLRERGIEASYVFADTGWEHPSTIEYIQTELTRVLGPITTVANTTMRELVLKKGMFPSRTRRFCTTELKVRPLSKWAIEHEIEVMAVGIRKAESEERAKMTEWEFSKDFDCDVWRPLLEWTEEDVIQIHKRHGLAPNPLYLQGLSRVGCWPCIFARKAEVAMLDEARIAEIRELEELVGDGAVERAVRDGKTLKEAGLIRPTFFQGRIRDKDGNRPNWDIDRTEEWSKTPLGGRKLVVLEDVARDSCVRWGLCETETGGEV
jgi:3'-phosphoadenosine 5'-phosphosulfate sulfotransferase (PAPS reductase)/FAD synthetase